MAVIMSSKFCTRISYWLISNDLAWNWVNVMLIVSIVDATAYVMIHHWSDGIKSGRLSLVCSRSER
jgi:hypothetical protein